MTDNDTSCRSQKCPLMYVVVVILVRVKHYQFVDGKYLAVWPNFHVLTAMGGSRMTQFDGFGFMMCCVNPHVTNLMLANCNSTLGHQTTNLILLMRDSI